MSLLSVFLIATNHTFVQFMHFTFSANYNKYLDTTTRSIQEKLANDKNKETYNKYLHATTRSIQEKLANDEGLLLAPITTNI